MNGNDKIDYRYLNLTTKKFTKSQETLTEELNGISGAVLLYITNSYGQVLIAGGNSDINECYALKVCKRLSNTLSLGSNDK